MTLEKSYYVDSIMIFGVFNQNLISSAFLSTHGFISLTSKVTRKQVLKSQPAPKHRCLNIFCRISLKQTGLCGLYTLIVVA